MRLDVSPRQQVIEPAHRSAVGDLGEDFAQIGKELDAVELAESLPNRTPTCANLKIVGIGDGILSKEKLVFVPKINVVEE